MFAKQSTALTLICGPILDSTGAEYTTAVIGDLSISKNGGTLTALAAAATLTHIANAQYTLVLTTGNTDTLGVIQISCNKSTYQMPMVERHVIPANVYDSLVLGSDTLDVNTLTMDAAVVTAIQSGLATSAVLTTVAGYLDTEIASILEDTGTTLPAQIAAIAPANLVVAATSTALSVIDSAGDIEIHRGDRASFGITGLGSLSGRTGEKLFFTVKTSKTNDLTDANAILQITETSSCVLVNGAAPVAASDATLTVDDAASGDVTIILKSAVTNELTTGSKMFYDVQMIRSDGEPVTLTEGRFEVVADVTRRESL